MAMGDLARLPRPDEDGSDSYDVPMGSLLRADDGRLMAPPRNPAMPPQSVVDLFAPNLSRPETYAPRSADLVPNAAGKVPTSDPLSTGAAADLANMAGYAIPFGGPTAATTKLALPLLAVGRRLVPAAEEAAATGIRAYHSSPHDFEKFDFGAGTARTGEGAQTYGPGGYFAENPAVSGQGGKYWNQFLPRFAGTPEWEAALALRRGGFDREAVTRQMRAYVEDLRKAGDSDWRKSVLPLLESGKPVGPRTYEVNIKAHPDEMLNYDVPLAQQSEGVRENLKELIGRGWNEFRHADPHTAINQGLVDFDPRAAAFRMQEAGIPGIRYLDQGSRAFTDMISVAKRDLQRAIEKGDDHQITRIKAGIADLENRAEKGTHNYVMFPGTEDRVHIMAKYGLAGAVPTMGSLADMSYREQ
jgi:hypothetical protein